MQEEAMILVLLLELLVHGVIPIKRIHQEWMPDEFHVLTDLMLAPRFNLHLHVRS